LEFGYRLALGSYHLALNQLLASDKVGGWIGGGQIQLSLYSELSNQRELAQSSWLTICSAPDLNALVQVSQVYFLVRVQTRRSNSREVVVQIRRSILLYKLVLVVANTSTGFISLV